MTARCLHSFPGRGPPCLRATVLVANRGIPTLFGDQLLTSTHPRKSISMPEKFEAMESAITVAQPPAAFSISAKPRFMTWFAETRFRTTGSRGCISNPQKLPIGCGAVHSRRPAFKKENSKARLSLECLPT